MLRPGELLQNRYEILEKIGSGGMSDVYKAFCRKLNRSVAIKVLKEEFSDNSSFVSKFNLEAQAAARLSHPNIVNVFDVIDEGCLHYIVMELIEGITLKNYISKKRRLEVKETIGIAIQVAQGISAAHEQHIIHRDIKPQNMIISKDGKVKVADFGIARAVSSQTLNSTAMGSVHYIAPEQARGGYSDERSDIYSLGITMYEMVTGRVPFEGDNTVSIALAHLEEPIAPPSVYSPDISIALEKIILKCTEKKQERRYGSVDEVIGDLRKALLRPDEDFVKQVPIADDSAQTVMFSSEELLKIKEGGKRSTIKTWEEEEYSNRRPDSYQNDPPKRQRAGSTKSAEGRKPSSGRTNKQDSNVSPQIEKIMTAAGIVAAILIVAVLVYMFIKLGGIFNVGSGNSKDATNLSVSQSTEETIKDSETLMPNVVGMSENVARSKLSNSNLDMIIDGYENSDLYEKGQVIRQSIEEDAVIAKWSKIGVTLSQGPVLIDLTALNLDKLTGDQAKNILENRKLVVTIEEENHDTIELGKVVRFSPEKLKEGEMVTLFVSKGPAVEMTQVPDLLGEEEEIADELLADLGLVPGTVKQVFDDMSEAGIVISQDIAPGTQIEKGAAISYSVSKGPEKSEDDNYKFVASIAEDFPLKNVFGPGSSGMKVEVKIRLRQVVGGEETYKTLMETTQITGGATVLPVRFTNFEGAYGVETGTVEVYDVGNKMILASYPVTFVRLPKDGV